MMSYLRAGGWGTWLILALGLATMYTAARFAWSADARRLSIIRALSGATIFAVLAGSASGFIAVASHIVHQPELRGDELVRVLLEGLGEVATLPGLGFMQLTIVWMFVAVGTRRLQDRDL
jgi:hypothetical protein